MPVTSEDAGGRGAARSAWRAVVGLTLAVLLLRVAYQVALNPLELAADEAHYWDWARRPALSYYSKGPGVAWVIGSSTAVLGDHAWSVRLPAAAAAAAAMLAAAGLAFRFTDDRRAGLYAAALVALVPGFSTTAQFMTIDMPFFACWLGACWAAARLFDDLRAGRSAWGAWATLGAVLGVGFLFKYTILLLLPGLAIYACVERGSLQRWRGAVLGLAVFAVGISPVLSWNARHGWPTVAHLLGHLNAPGGDVQSREAWSYHPLYTLEMLGTQIAAVGPALGLIVLARRHVTRRSLLLVCCSGPVLAFYLLVSVVTDVEANWPLPGWLALLVLAAIPLGGWLDDYRAKVAAWSSLPPSQRPRAGWLRRRPETAGQMAWHWTVGYGVVALAGLMGISWVAGVPGRDRVTGHAARAQAVAREAAALHDPFIVADQYGRASLLAFYLPGRPSVCSAQSYRQGRRSSYDYFADTDLRDPARLGRDAMLVGGSLQRWQQTLAFDHIEATAALGVYRARGYRGPQP